MIGIAAGAAASACDAPDSAAEVVASTRHCGSESITPTLSIRLSGYSAGIPSDDIWIVQICHPDRGCNAAASFMDGLVPQTALTPEALRITIPMAQDLEVFRETVWVDGEEIPLVVEAQPISTEAERQLAFASAGLPPEQRSFRRACHSDLAPRPYFRTSDAQAAPIAAETGSPAAQ